METADQQYDTHPIEPGKILLDDEGRLCEDAICLQCGYNLKTLLLQADCPECGTEVSLSVRGDSLQFSHPKWVKKITTGMTCIWLSAVFFIILGIGFTLSWGMAMLAMGDPDERAWRSIAISVSILTKFASLAVMVLLVAGVFMFTAFEANSLASEKSFGSRLIIRCSLIVIVVMTLLEMVFRISNYGNAARAVSLAFGISLLFFLFSMLVYLRKMAMRIPDDSLTRHTSIVMCGWAVLLIIAAPGGALLACPLLMGMIILAIWLLILIDAYKKAFAAAAVRAKEHSQLSMQDIESLI